MASGGTTARAAGIERDAAILEMINQCRFASRDQVQELIFGHEYRQRACKRLLTLYKAKKVGRKRIENTQPFIYFPTGQKWNQKFEHYLLLNEVYIALVKQIKSWFKLHVFKREYFCQWDGGHLLADALLVLNNTTTKRLKPVFIEVDRAQSNNRFDKVPKYTDYYNSKVWVEKWWAQPDPEGVYHFPKVLVVTDRQEQVQAVIKKENEAGIRFAVAKINNVMSDVYQYV